MVRVTIIGEHYGHLGLEFDFANCELAGKFMEMAMNAAVGKVKFEVEKVENPEKEMLFEEPQESRFINPAELEEVPTEELADTDGLFGEG